MQTIGLALTSEQSPERVDQLTTELVREVGRIPGVEVNREAAAPGTGEKGAAWGDILLAVFGAGGAASALIACLRGYVERDRTLAFELKCPNGTVVRLSGKRLSADEGKMALQALELCLASGAAAERPADG